MSTCAYPQCQAGGTILDGAPVWVEWSDVVMMEGERTYHPGCWAAMQREAGTAK